MFWCLNLEIIPTDLASFDVFLQDTVNDRLNTLGVYLKIQNVKGAYIRERHLIKRGVYFEMHKFRKQKWTFSGTCCNRTIATKIGLEAKTSSVKIFVGKNFRHLPKISSLFTDEYFNLVFYMRTFL